MNGPQRALGKKYPGGLYTPPSAREYHRPNPSEYPYHDHTIQMA